MNATHNLPESSSPDKIEITIQELLRELPRRKTKYSAARVPFLGTLPEEEWKVHHRDHENRTGCGMDKIAIMEEA